MSLIKQISNSNEHNLYNLILTLPRYTPHTSTQHNFVCTATLPCHYLCTIDRFTKNFLYLEVHLHRTQLSYQTHSHTLYLSWLNVLLHTYTTCLCTVVLLQTNDIIYFETNKKKINICSWNCTFYISHTYFCTSFYFIITLYLSYVFIYIKIVQNCIFFLTCHKISIKAKNCRFFSLDENTELK